nr:hypothetical protein [Tanacetum cinerariifolium]GEX83972.1 hypothetical protein [Tanacetum cinerariifolium]
ESIDETPPSDAIAPDLPITDSLVMKDEHLDTIPGMDSDEEIESSVKDLNLTPGESEDLTDYVSECDLPFCDNSPDFNNDSEIFFDPLFDSKDDYTSSDDESSSVEDVLVEHFKIYSSTLLKFNEEIFSNEINPLYNEVLKDLDPIPPGNENDHFNAESNLIESLINKDTMITSPMIDSFSRSSPKLLYDNSSPRPPKELNSENDFKKENNFHDDLAHIISPSEYEYVYDDDEFDSGDLATKVVDDISDNSTRELYDHVHNVLTTLPTLYPVFNTLLLISSKNKDKVFNLGILISKEEKSPLLLSHRGLKVFQLINDFESPMMIYGGDMPILDVPYLHFYPL